MWIWTDDSTGHNDIYCRYVSDHQPINCKSAADRYWADYADVAQVNFPAWEHFQQSGKWQGKIWYAHKQSVIACDVRACSDRLVAITGTLSSAARTVDTLRFRTIGSTLPRVAIKPPSWATTTSSRSTCPSTSRSMISKSPASRSAQMGTSHSVANSLRSATALRSRTATSRTT